MVLPSLIAHFLKGSLDRSVDLAVEYVLLENRNTPPFSSLHSNGEMRHLSLRVLPIPR